MNGERTQTLPLDYIRGLVVHQNGKCAITGVALDPTETNADHIVPLSRKELNPQEGIENIWIVNKIVNAMKGALSYDEFLKLAKLVVSHETETRKLLEDIKTAKITGVSKKNFDAWVNRNCDSEGKIKL